MHVCLMSICVQQNRFACLTFSLLLIKHETVWLLLFPIFLSFGCFSHPHNSSHICLFSSQNQKYSYFNIEIGSPIYSLLCIWLLADENNPSFPYMRMFQCHSSQHNIIPHIFHFLSNKDHRMCIDKAHDHTPYEYVSSNGFAQKISDNLCTHFKFSALHCVHVDTQNKKAISFTVHIFPF